MRDSLCAAAMAVACFAGAAAQTPTGVIQPVDALEWSIETPGQPVQIAGLWGNRARGAAGVLTKVPGGWTSRPHGHTADYHAFVVAGRWELSPGSYVMQPGGGMHIDRCKAGTECVLFVFQNSKADVIWPHR